MAKKRTAKKSAPKKAARKTAKKTPATKAAKKKKRRTGKRELIDTGRDKRFVRRDGEGQFSEVDNVSRSLSLDRRRKAKKKVKAGYGDRGDR